MQRTADDRPSPRIGVAVALLAVIAAVVVVWLLRSAFMIFMPLALALFVAVLLRPLQRWLADRLPGPRWISVAIVMLLLLGLFAGISTVVFQLAEEVAPAVPEYGERLQERWQVVRDWLTRHEVLSEGASLTDDGNLGDRLLGWLRFGLSTLWDVASVLLLLYFFVLLMLLEADRWRESLRAGFRGSDSIRDSVDAIAHKVRWYILVRIFVSLISGLATALITWALGVDFWYLWGTFTFLMNFIPIIGSIISVLPPTLIALVMPDGGWTWAIAVAASLTLKEQIVGNLLDPKLQGKALRVSPVVVLFSVLFWGWVWGLMGAVLALPMTVTVVVIFAHVRPLRPIALLLTGEATIEDTVEATHGEAGGA